MTITCVTREVYRISDGKIFETYEDAVNFELMTEVGKWAAVAGIYGTAAFDVTQAIIKNRASLMKILNSMEPVIIVPPCPPVPCGPWHQYEIRSDGTGGTI